MHFHGLRHTQAPMLLAQGSTGKRGTEARFGHARASITLDVYGRLLLKGRDAEIAERLERRLRG